MRGCCGRKDAYAKLIRLGGLTARQARKRTMVRVAHAYEQATDWHSLRPELRAVP